MNSILKKYQNRHLNNQYMMFTLQEFVCPICDQKLITDCSLGSQHIYYSCSFEIVMFLDSMIFGISCSAFQNLKFITYYKFNYRLGKNLRCDNLINLDLSIFEKLKHDLEIVSFYE
jgi:hypothetical protein